jgi:hypothetical protein
VKYKDLYIKSYARSASNFIMYNCLSIEPQIKVNKSLWANLGQDLDNSVTVTVLRNPIESIVSNAAMSFTNNGIENVNFKDIDYSFYINDFKNYIDLVLKNINIVIPFTFKQIIYEPKKSFNIFLNECGYYEDFVFPFVEIKEKNVLNLNNNKKQKFFPTSKNLKIYKDIELAVNESEDLKNLYEYYDYCKNKIYRRQLDF